MDGFKIRQATLADKADVLGIHDHVYEGHDYLPEFYDYLLSLEDARAFVLQHEGKIIGFNMACIIDQGYTAVSRAARISPEYEGRGLYRYLDNHVTDWIKGREVSVKAFTAVNLNPNVMKPSFQTHNKLIMTQLFYVYLFDHEKMALGDTSAEELGCIKDISDSELSTYITSPVIPTYLFPSDRIIVNFVPFRLIDTNIKFMRGPMKFTKVFSDIRTNSGGCEGLLSFGILYKVQVVPYRYEINVFGSDLRSFKAHIVKHLERLKDTAHGSSHVVVALDERFPPDMVNSVFKEFGGLQQTHPTIKSPGPYYAVQYLFEKTL